MNIKEKAKELSGMFSYEARTNEYCRECTQQACEMMAHWVVNKAVEWMKDDLFSEDVLNNGDIYVCSSTANSVDEFIDNFKKAMEQ